MSGREYSECLWDGMVGLSYATATAGFTINSPTPFVMVAEVSQKTTGQTMRRTGVPYPGTGEISRFKIDIRRSGSSVFSATGYRKGDVATPVGLTFTPDPVISGQENASIDLGLFQGETEFVATYTEAIDKAFDLNGDGGFDQADVDWLESNFVSIAPEVNPYTVKGNFVTSDYSQDPPAPEAIDQADADFLAAALAAVGPSSRAGDVNDDGVLDCQDSYGALAFFDSQIGDADYVYALDMNRDGIVDQSDKIAFFGLVNQCDFNQDGSVDDSDFTIFANAYGLLDCADPAMPAYCPADLNVDGVVDDADFAIFIIRYNNVVC